MREVIQIHVGQAGIQMGNSCWELFCLEHNISPNGENLAPPNKDGRKGEEINICGDPETYNPNDTFFYESSPSMVTPRAVMVDLEPTVVDEIRTGMYRDLWHSDSLISGKECAANNYARGYYTIGKEKILDTTLDRIRKLAEMCSGHQGFMIFNAVGGGTGSGFCCRVQEKLTVEYGKKSKIHFTVWPSPDMSTSVVEPYNAIACVHSLMEHSNVTFQLCNQQLYGLLKRNLDIERPTYQNLNRIIAQVVSSVTAPLRLPGSMNMDLSDLQSNLVPDRHAHFMLCSWAPLVSTKKELKEALTVCDITNSVFEKENMMLSCDPGAGKYMACCLMYRGDVIPNDAYKAVETILQKKIEFSDWSPKPFKIGITYPPPAIVSDSGLATVARSVCHMANNTAIQSVFNRLDHKFDLLFSKRAFVHWYVDEGMEEEQLTMARESMAALEKDYVELAATVKIGGEEGEM